VACWIRRAEIEAARVELPDYDRPQFLEAIREIRSHVTGDLLHYQERMEALCRQAGVRLIFLPHLPKMNIGGVTFWLRPQGNPVIVLSLRWNSDDHLWFNFFHEAKHVLQEMKKRLFLDQPGDAVDDPKEQEANRFAANLLIPSDRFAAFCSRCSRPRAGDIVAFAQEHNVTPGIVLGQLQHSGILHYGTSLERLKKQFAFAARNH
jgi:Zn-dependent peptidase ImmA (M78 family)